MNSRSAEAQDIVNERQPEETRLHTLATHRDVSQANASLRISTLATYLAGAEFVTVEGKCVYKCSCTCADCKHDLLREMAGAAAAA